MPDTSSVDPGVKPVESVHDGMPAGWPRIFAVATITIGLSMSVLANSMTNLALPYIAHDLDISAESSIWIVNASQIALMISLLPVAALADIVGYRHVYRFGLALFSLASIGCALAQRYLPHTSHTHRPFDVASAALSGATFGLLIFGIDGMAHGHQRAVIAGELVLAAVLGAAFVWRQRRLSEPMMPIDVFRRPI